MVANCTHPVKNQRMKVFRGFQVSLCLGRARSLPSGRTVALLFQTRKAVAARIGQ